MTHPSKVKGNTFERSLVKDAQSQGLEAYRCYASDGRSRGLASDVDLVVSGVKFQCKRKAELPGWLGLSQHVDGVVLREDHGESVVVLRWTDYLKLLASQQGAHDGGRHDGGRNLECLVTSPSDTEVLQ